MGRCEPGEMARQLGKGEKKLVGDKPRHWDGQQGSCSCRAASEQSPAAAPGQARAPKGPNAGQSRAGSDAGGSTGREQPRSRRLATGTNWCAARQDSLAAPRGSAQRFLSTAAPRGTAPQPWGHRGLQDLSCGSRSSSWGQLQPHSLGEHPIKGFCRAPQHATHATTSWKSTLPEQAHMCRYERSTQHHQHQHPSAHKPLTNGVKPPLSPIPLSATTYKTPTPHQAARASNTKSPSKPHSLHPQHPTKRWEAL